LVCRNFIIQKKQDEAMHTAPTLLWFRQDLRLEDHPALQAAMSKGGAIIPVYIWSPEEEGEWSLGGASKWWLHGSLLSLQNELKAAGLSLIIRRGSSQEVLNSLAEEVSADAVFWSRRYEPYAIKRDAAIKAALKKKGLQAQSFNSSLLYEPWTISNRQQKPFQVFTPFWRHCTSSQEPDLPLSKPLTLTHHCYRDVIDSDSLDMLDLLPKHRWDSGLTEFWQPGTLGAKKHLNDALKNVVENYIETRDYPAIAGTSTLSPYLHFGEISPRMIWHAVKQHIQGEAGEPFLRQLGWREFAHHLLYHFPHTPCQPLRSQFNAFPWNDDDEMLKKWQKGYTGYPIVDAGMRQLWSTGWMHNRVRMIVGSFLVKDLLLPWQRGAQWFWDTLVDADLANNTLGWQWVGGCGADAAPYFRIFNPVRQGEKFDEDGVYVKRWVPELKDLPAQWIHKPWEAPDNILRQAGVILGETYPKPIVDHAEARERALQAFAFIKE
jgi:deoxyribodipyrimidine photo-lyase